MTGRVFSKLLLSFFVLTICTAMLDFSIRRIVDSALHEEVEQSLAGEARFLAAELNFAPPQQVQQLLARRFLRISARTAVFRPELDRSSPIPAPPRCVIRSRLCPPSPRSRAMTASAVRYANGTRFHCGPSERPHRDATWKVSAQEIARQAPPAAA